MLVALRCSNPRCGHTLTHKGSGKDRPDRCPECGSAMTEGGQGTPSGRKAPVEVELPEMFGRYRIIKRLGGGGMGAVFLAEDSSLDRVVALKVPHLDDEAGEGPSSETLQRFRREARSAAAIQHSSVCPIHDIGEIDGIPYISMAYIEGRTLTERINAKGAVPPSEAVTLVRRLASALDAGHRRGVIHRDLKPDNVMLNAAGEPILLDFGIARRIADVEGSIAVSGEMLGTPHYMSPEQIDGARDKICPATDVYALGVILYELLTGRKPFEGPITKVLVRIIIDEPVPPANLRPEVGPALSAACLRALEKRPEDRYATMDSFSSALKHALAFDRGGLSSTKLPAPPRPRADDTGKISGFATRPPAAIEKAEPNLSVGEQRAFSPDAPPPSSSKTSKERRSSRSSTDARPSSPPKEGRSSSPPSSTSSKGGRSSGSSKEREPKPRDDDPGSIAPGQRVVAPTVAPSPAPSKVKAPRGPSPPVPLVSIAENRGRRSSLMLVLWGLVAFLMALVVAVVGYYAFRDILFVAQPGGN